MTPAEEHRRIAGVFTERVRGAAPSAWDRPAPPDGWTARDVVRHLVEWFPAFLQSGAGITLPQGPSVDDDPVAAWTVHSDGVQALLNDPATPGKVLSNPHTGDVPLDQAIRLVAGEPGFDQGQQEPLAEVQAVARGQVLPHPLGPDD